MTPAVFLAVRDEQAVRFRRFLEAAVVIGAAAAAVLNAVFEVVVMAHLMEEGSADVFDWPRERSRSDVDFMRSAELGDPGVLSKREVTIGARRALNGDRRP